MSDPDQDKPPGPEELLLAAFEAARVKGKPDWHRMRIAVLKNRLLQTTGGEFREGSYGATSFREFLAKFPHLLRVDGTNIELIEGRGTDARQQVRPDLWQAMMDFSSGRTYAWDSESRSARPAEESDTLIVPTLSPDDMAGWRKDFAASHPEDTRVQNWSAQAMGTSALPRRLQGVWTGTVRDRVVQKLESWLESVGISDVEPVVNADPTTAVREKEGGDALREFVLRCVAAMTAQELSSLPLPASAVVRAIGAKK